MARGITYQTEAGALTLSPKAQRAFEALCACGGNAVLASKVCDMSERQLRRRCEVAIGYGPKTLDRVLRFQRFRCLRDRRAASLAQLAFESGYADQAHLTREYLRLAGTTPGLRSTKGTSRGRLQQ